VPSDLPHKALDPEASRRAFQTRIKKQSKEAGARPVGGLTVYGRHVTAEHGHRPAARSVSTADATRSASYEIRTEIQLVRVDDVGFFFDTEPPEEAGIVARERGQFD
jgi:hypothetical protein